jgi:hypothetical protein
MLAGVHLDGQKGGGGLFRTLVHVLPFMVRGRVPKGPVSTVSIERGHDHRAVASRRLQPGWTRRYARSIMRKPEQGRLRHGRGKLAAEHWSRTIRGRFPRERDQRASKLSALSSLQQNDAQFRDS